MAIGSVSVKMRNANKGNNSSGGLSDEVISLITKYAGDLQNFHHVEMGFDNVGIGVIEGERSFQTIVVGDNNIYGENSFVWGYNNEALLTSSMSFVYGSFNKTYQNQIIFGGHNEFPNSTDITVFGMGNKGDAKSRTTLVVGCMNQIKAPCSYTIGYRITSEAKGSRAIGRYFTISNEPKNEQGFFLGDGDKDKGFISFAHRVNKSVANPLFGQTGEPQFIAERGIRTEYLGALKPVAKTININGTSTANLDIEAYGEFILTGSGTANIVLENWQNGDTAMLIKSSSISCNIPANWVGDFVSNFSVLKIAKYNNTIYYKKEF